MIVPFEAQIGSAEFGILNAFGIRTIKVYKKPVVTVISTGSEVGVIFLVVSFVNYLQNYNFYSSSLPW